MEKIHSPWSIISSNTQKKVFYFTAMANSHQSTFYLKIMIQKETHWNSFKRNVNIRIYFSHLCFLHSLKSNPTLQISYSLNKYLEPTQIIQSLKKKEQIMKNIWRILMTPWIPYNFSLRENIRHTHPEKNQRRFKQLKTNAKIWRVKCTAGMKSIEKKIPFWNRKFKNQYLSPIKAFKGLESMW
jgi:hypothetical protein